MKKAIVLISLFAVCILMALPLTSVAESSEVVDHLPDSKSVVVNRLSSLRDSIKERISKCDMSSSVSQGGYISCLIGFILLTIGIILSLFGL